MAISTQSASKTSHWLRTPPPLCSSPMSKCVGDVSWRSRILCLRLFFQMAETFLHPLINQEVFSLPVVGNRLVISTAIEGDSPRSRWGFFFFIHSFFYFFLPWLKQVPFKTIHSPLRTASSWQQGCNYFVTIVACCFKLGGIFTTSHSEPRAADSCE